MNSSDNSGSGEKDSSSALPAYAWELLQNGHHKLVQIMTKNSEQNGQNGPLSSDSFQSSSSSSFSDSSDDEAFTYEWSPNSMIADKDHDEEEEVIDNSSIDYYSNGQNWNDFERFVLSLSLSDLMLSTILTNLIVPFHRRR